MPRRLAVLLALSLVPACGAPAEAPAAPDVVPAVVPSAGQAVRVGGSADVLARNADGHYTAPRVALDTPLPQGYPPPTPPGAIELKSYPPVRRAEVRGQGDPDDGMNDAFWPLFRHIQQHDIAMTTPVEMDFRDLPAPGASGEPATRDWSMSFLYRTPELNATGQEGVVTVRDAEGLTVLAVGLRGDYGMDLVQEGMARLEDWLARHPQWQPAGPWRTLYYNGPKLLFWNKWAEVQLPVRPAGAASAPAG